jgi:hypothetical protein
VYFVLLAVTDSDHHYSRQRKDGTKTPASLYATHPRHLNIEEYQIGPAPAGAFDCFFSCPGFFDGITVRGERTPQCAAHGRIIIDNQDFDWR